MPRPARIAKLLSLCTVVLLWPTGGAAIADAPEVALPADVPDAAAIAAATKQVSAAFGDDWQPGDAAETKALIERLTVAAAKTDDLASRYVMWRRAVELAAGLGDVKLLLGNLDAMHEQFKLDPIAYRHEMYRAAQRAVREPADARRLAFAAAVVGDAAIDADRYAEALQVVQLTDRLARAARHTSLVSFARVRMTRIRRLMGSYRRLTAHAHTLERNPDDPEACGALGRFYAFEKGDWPRGLKLLARSDDETLAGIASADLAADETVEAHLKLAERWWDLTAGVDTSVTRGRAVQWYAQSLDQLDGLEKVRIEARISDYYRSLPQGGQGPIRAGNVALTANGATAEAPSKAEELIDGNHTRYTGYSGFASGAYPCDFIVKLDREYALQMVRVKLWNGDDRRYQYVASVSADGERWTTIADHARKWSRGWQDIKFTARPVRFIKVRGTRNNWNTGFHIIEIEAYCKPPK